MSLDKQLLPTLKNLGEEFAEDVSDEFKKVEDKAEGAMDNIKEGFKTIGEKITDIGKEETWSNPISDFFSKFGDEKQKKDDVDDAVPDEEGLDEAVPDDAVPDDAVPDDAVPDEDSGTDKDEDEESDEDAGPYKDKDSNPDKDEEQDSQKPMSKVIEQTLGINTLSSEEDTDSDDDDYLQKFDADVRQNYLLDFHPEAQTHNYEEVKKFATVKRNKNGDIIDLLHRTIPILTKYEKTRVLGQRAKQLNSGAQSTVKIPDSTIDGYLMAVVELRQRKLPFIIRRPIPNGGFEYWKVNDLELLE